MRLVRTKCVLVTVTLLSFATAAQGENFYPVEFGVPTIISSTTSDDASLGDLWAVSNLLQGPDVGFGEDEPHTGELNGPETAWVTVDNAGFPADYIEDVSIPNGVFPRIVFDFGDDAPLDEISVWAYSPTNSNGVSEFVLEFASDADGPDGFENGGFSTLEFYPQNAFQCGDDPTWLPAAGSDMVPGNDCGPARQSFEFGELIHARYVALTVTDNYYYGEGRGEGGFIDDGDVFYEGYRELPGGDRVGLGEVAFRIPEDQPVANCDFDQSGTCDLADLDELLYTGLVSGDVKYDLDGSGTVDLKDRDVFLGELGTLTGDFDLNGSVNATDLNVLGRKWQESVSSYADGDANGDGIANATDLNDVGSNWQYGVVAAAQAATVPEPTGAALALVAVMAMAMMRRK